ncbi:MAG: GxxExxY protein [Desulfuromonadales bacterium]|nr:GxxExxY protein [Desulfuromonadales bacterium]
MAFNTLNEKADFHSRQVIGAAMDVHRILGPGLLESAYEECLCRELSLRSIPYIRQVVLPLEYKGIHIDCAYRIDILVDDCLILEIKATTRIKPVHEAQLLTYLRLKRVWLGLLINFNVPVLKDGLRRLVNG